MGKVRAEERYKMKRGDSAKEREEREREAGRKRKGRRTRKRQ